MLNQNTSKSQPNNVIFYDGVCLLCNQFVIFVLNRDKSNHLFFAPLQGTTAKKYLNQQQIANLDSVYLYQNGHIYSQSDAIIRILESLSGYYGLFIILRIFPRFFRNWIYQVIAKYRYRIFGQDEFCQINHPKQNQILN